MRFKIIDFANVFLKTHLIITEAAESLSGRGKILIFIARIREKLIHDFFFNHMNCVLWSILDSKIAEMLLE